MTEKGLSIANGDWREAIDQRREQLEQLRLTLINLEAELADRLASINAFEFEFRARVRPLLARLEALETEIKGCLRQLHRDVPEKVREEWEAWTQDTDGTGVAGKYRFWEGSMPAPPPDVDQDRSADLKRLYRQLARRFHPDFAASDADREYCTQLMMEINAAYAVGDMGKLKELMKEPDIVHRIENAQTDQQLAEALLLEIERCRRRIHEIKGELATLAGNESAVLMRRSEEAAGKGEDFVANVMAQLRRRIHRKMVERDALKVEVESLSVAGEGLHGDAFADVIWDLNLDQVFDEDPEVSFAEWFMGDLSRYTSDDDILDDNE